MTPHMVTTNTIKNHTYVVTINVKSNGVSLVQIIIPYNFLTMRV